MTRLRPQTVLALAGVAFALAIAIFAAARRTQPGYAGVLRDMDAFCETTANQVRELATRLADPAHAKAARDDYKERYLMFDALTLCSRSIDDAAMLRWCGAFSDDACMKSEAAWLAMLWELRRRYR